MEGDPGLLFHILNERFIGAINTVIRSQVIPLDVVFTVSRTLVWGNDQLVASLLTGYSLRS
jgi:hypothetical protein